MTEAEARDHAGRYLEQRSTGDNLGYLVARKGGRRVLATNRATKTAGPP